MDALSLSTHWKRNVTWRAVHYLALWYLHYLYIDLHCNVKFKLLALTHFVWKLIKWIGTYWSSDFNKTKLEQISIHAYPWKEMSHRKPFIISYWSLCMLICIIGEISWAVIVIQWVTSWTQSANVVLHSHVKSFWCWFVMLGDLWTIAFTSLPSKKWCFW